MKNKIFLICLSMLFFACAENKKQEVQKTEKQFEASWESLKKAPVAPWFEDAKFGIFIHWGAYSVVGHIKGGKGYAEHVPKLIYSDPEYYYPYLKKYFGAHPPEFGYKDIVKQFKAENWDPDAWAELFHKAGAKYVILTGEHHDGFALWDSELTNWCATKVGPMRDLVGDLAKAVRAKGMKFAPSYHRERHTGFFAKEKYAINSEPRPDIAEEIKRSPEANGLYGPEFSYNDAFINDYLARWKELQDKYKPDFMWIDDIPIFYKANGHPQSQKFQDAFKFLIADYFNTAEEWGKDVYLNNKGRHLNWPDGVGCREKDNLNLTKIGPKWQNPATMGTSYGYVKEEEMQDAYKSPKELIHLLCDVVSKNGNLLLNIGPRADGTIPKGMKKRLLAIGSWLSVNGEAIYGSRPWKDYGEGPNLIQYDISGHNEDGKKKDKKKLYTDKSIRYTQSADGKTIFAIQLLWSEDGHVIAEKLRQNAGLLEGRIRNISLLGSNEKVSWKRRDGGLHMYTNAQKPNEYAYVWKIELE